MPITIRQIKSRLDSIPTEVAVQEAERIVQARPKLEYVPFFPSEFARRLDKRDCEWWSYVPFYGSILLPRKILPRNTSYLIVLLTATIQEIDAKVLLRLGRYGLTVHSKYQSTVHGDGGRLTEANPYSLVLVIDGPTNTSEYPRILTRP